MLKSSAWPVIGQLREPQGDDHEVERERNMPSPERQDGSDKASNSLSLSHTDDLPPRFHPKSFFPA